MRYFALILFVSAVSCGVIKDRVEERMKREINPDFLTISLDGNQKLESDSLVQGLPSDADLERVVQALGKQTQNLANEINKQLQEAGVQPNSAQISSVSMRMMVVTIALTLVKLLI